MENSTKHNYNQGNHSFQNTTQSKEIEKSTQNMDTNQYFQSHNQSFGNTANKNNSYPENNHYPTERRRSFTSVFDL